MIKVFRGSPLLGCPYLNLYEREHPKSHALLCTALLMPPGATRYTLTRKQLTIYNRDGEIIATHTTTKEFAL